MASPLSLDDLIADAQDAFHECRYADALEGVERVLSLAPREGDAHMVKTLSLYHVAK